MGDVIRAGSRSQRSAFVWVRRRRRYDPRLGCRGFRPGLAAGCVGATAAAREADGSLRTALRKPSTGGRLDARPRALGVEPCRSSAARRPGRAMEWSAPASVDSGWLGSVLLFFLFHFL